MKVSTSHPFQIVYSLYEHEYFGFLVESYVVQLDELGRLSYSSQNVGVKNAKEFASGLDEIDYKLIDLTEQIHQDEIFKRFNTKRLDPVKFYTKTFSKERPIGKAETKQADESKLIRAQISKYIETRKGEILSLILEHDKKLFEMGSDGIVTWKRIEIQNEPATVRFNFFKNEDNTHYFPTIRFAGKKLDYQYQDAIVIALYPAFLLLHGKLYWFNSDLDGKKLKPFLKKKFIQIPLRMEETYYSNFIAPLVARHDVFAQGFDINEEKFDPIVELHYITSKGTQKQLVIGGDSESSEEGAGVVNFSLMFNYGGHVFQDVSKTQYSVDLQQKGERDYVFHRVRREMDLEKRVVARLRKMGLSLINGRISLSEYNAANWLAENQQSLEELGAVVMSKGEKKQSAKGTANDPEKTEYFSGKGVLDISINEGTDWFDIKAKVMFGEYEISFQKIREYVMKDKRMIELPNGQMAALDPAWFGEYKEFFSFLDKPAKAKEGEMTLKKHHLVLVKMMDEKKLAEVSMRGELRKLENFQEIEDFPLPLNFKGELRPYQKAGYNWMNFLDSFSFGGCLADDMGLGKTVQTLALLQKQKENGRQASLLIMPTSLVYNWQLEARKFAPKLRVMSYVGTGREKNPDNFNYADIVITSYGTARIDSEVLQKFDFNYIILDESQIIKNPNSSTAKQLNKLKSRQRLILTGTPLENTTLDLWSQINFVNPGLLGTQKYFKENFLIPIEKNGDTAKVKRLHTLIKPFILRRNKSQVAKDLPEKVESLQFCKMSDDQAEAYKAAKNHYRNKIFEDIEVMGIRKSQMAIFQGLAKLRQIANHPKMVDPEYTGDSGKMDDATEKLTRVIEEGHKVLVFSQFVKHLSLYKEYLKKKNIRFSYLDGSTKDRQTEVQNFQNDESIRVFLISLKAGGVGLNLTAADYVFLLDPWYNPAIERQAIDRTHRIGQTKNVFIYKFISLETVEEKILKLQEHKQNLADNLISSEESFMKSLSQEDIMSILS